MDSDNNLAISKQASRGGARAPAKKAKTAKQRLAMADGGMDP